jgi:carboxymethylenebutenolidase
LSNSLKETWIVNEMQRYLVEEAVEDYEEGRLSRRQALKAVAGVTGAMLAAQILQARAQAAPGPAAKAQSGSAPLVAPDDPSIVSGVAEFPGEGARLAGYLARPGEPGRFPIVLVCHENRGLTRHIEDVVRRVAKAGYVGLAVDLLSREGGTAKHAFDAIPGILGKAAPARHVQDYRSGLVYARSQPFARGDRAGMVGFCFGGGVTWRVAAGVPELRAAVPFYGVPVQEGDVPKIGAAVLAIYAALDDRINQNIPAIEAAMQKYGKTFRKIVYPNVNHAFHNDTGDRYNAEAAKAAWSEALAWFAKYLA